MNPHNPSKAEYKAQLTAAIQWSQENPTEKLVISVRIHKVNPDSICIALKRMQKRNRTMHRGHNKVLTDTQTEAIQAYCKEHWEGGLGATKQMVFTAIGYLKAQEEPP